MTLSFICLENSSKEQFEEELNNFDMKIRGWKKNRNSLKDIFEARKN